MKSHTVLLQVKDLHRYSWKLLLLFIAACYSGNGSNKRALFRIQQVQNDAICLPHSAVVSILLPGVLWAYKCFDLWPLYLTRSFFPMYLYDNWKSNNGWCISIPTPCICIWMLRLQKMEVCFWNMLSKLAKFWEFVTFRVQCKTCLFMRFFDSDDRTPLNETRLALHW